MIIKRLIVGPLATNCYVLGDEQSREAMVIDPGAEPEKILQLLEKENLQLGKIVNTHGHVDHTSADDRLAVATGAEVYLHQDDIGTEKSPVDSLGLFLGKIVTPQASRRPLSDGQCLTVGSIKAKVIHTPGHTPGSICLLVDEVLFSGDLLFAGSVGRTDLPGGSYETLLKSLQKIASLPAELKVYPGHGEATTLGEEKKTNPYLVQR